MCESHAQACVRQLHSQRTRAFPGCPRHDSADLLETLPYLRPRPSAAYRSSNRTSGAGRYSAGMGGYSSSGMGRYASSGDDGYSSRQTGQGASRASYYGGRGGLGGRDESAGYGRAASGLGTGAGQSGMGGAGEGERASSYFLVSLLERRTNASMNPCRLRFER